jgi:hypothetical protein
MQIFVKTLTGKKSEFNVDEEDTVCEFYTLSNVSSFLCPFLNDQFSSALRAQISYQVLRLKNQLQEKEGIDVVQIRLIFNGKQLNDSEKLKDRNVKGAHHVAIVLYQFAPHLIALSAHRPSELNCFLNLVSIISAR